MNLQTTIVLSLTMLAIGFHSGKTATMNTETGGNSTNCSDNAEEEVLQAKINYCLNEVTPRYKEDTIRQAIKTLKFEDGLNSTKDMKLISCAATNLVKGITVDFVNAQEEMVTQDYSTTNQDIIDCITIAHNLLIVGADDVVKVGMCVVGAERVGEIVRCVINNQ